MKEIILGFFIGFVGCSIVGNFVWLVSNIFKQRTMKKEKDVQSIEALTIAATNDKSFVDDALSDCKSLISTIDTCELEEKLYKRVDILNESTHLYKLTMLFDVDSAIQSIDFDSYGNKYNYDPSQVRTYNYKELLTKQSFASKFFEYMFPEFDKIHKYNDSKNGICEINFTNNKDSNKCILEIKYFYASKNISINYPILNGYYFGCRIGSQIIVSELENTLERINTLVSNLDYIRPKDKQCITETIQLEQNNLNCHKFPQFKA